MRDGTAALDVRLQLCRDALRKHKGPCSLDGSGGVDRQRNRAISQNAVECQERTYQDRECPVLSFHSLSDFSSELALFFCLQLPQVVRKLCDPARKIDSRMRLNSFESPGSSSR
jgi:hypothetical protein